jgi:hypothetical protein
VVGHPSAVTVFRFKLYSCCHAAATPQQLCCCSRLAWGLDVQGTPGCLERWRGMGGRVAATAHSLRGFWFAACCSGPCCCCSRVPALAASVYTWLGVVGSVVCVYCCKQWGVQFHSLYQPAGSKCVGLYTCVQPMTVDRTAGADGPI